MGNLGGLRKLRHGPNGYINYEPLYKIPEGYRCYCHPCDMPFKSIDDMQKHTHSTQHTRNKEIYLQVKT